MAAFESEYFDLSMLDRLAGADSFVHRMDTRVKLLATALFTVLVVSFPKYEIAALTPFFVFPVAMAAAGGIPGRLIVKKVLAVSPFALIVGIFNPVLDTEPMLSVGGLVLSGGWISYISILIRFILTVSAGLLLVATTSFPGVCDGLEDFGVPRVFVVQLMFLYRYLFVLADEAGTMLRAHSARSVKGRGVAPHHFVHMLGTLFLRTVDRSERIYAAMLSRGFDGRIRMLRAKQLRFSDGLFLMAACAAMLLCRRIELVYGLGRAVTGAFIP